MNTKDIRTSTDPDLAGSYAAMERAARSAQDLAIKTNTGIVVAVDGKNVELTAADLIKLRDQEAQQSNHWAEICQSNSQLRAGFFVHPTFT